MIAVSSFCLRSQLGPIRIGYVDGGGGDQEFVLPYPAVIGVGEFARRTRDELGVDAIELCQIQLADLDEKGATALRAELDDLRVSVLTLPIDIGDLGASDPGRLERDLAANERWFRLAGILGCTFVRVNAGSPLGGSHPDIAVLDASLSRLADSATRLGLRLLIENHGGESSDPAFLLDLVDRVGRDRLGILLDLGNFEPMLSIQRAAMGGEAVDTAEADFGPLFEAIERIAPAASLVHAKTYGFDEQGRPRPFDAVRALDLVARAGYRGPVTVEFEGEGGDPWAQTARSVELVREAGLG